MAACVNGNKAMADLLLKRGAAVDETDMVGGQCEVRTVLYKFDIYGI